MSINRKGFFQKKVKKQKYNKFFSYNNKIRTDREFIYKNFEKVILIIQDLLARLLNILIFTR